MQLRNHSEIISAIHNRSEVLVTFVSKEDAGTILVRRCAPMDYAPSRHAHDKTPRYHFWDFDNDGGAQHVLSLPTSQLLSVEVLGSAFDPSKFVSSPTRWTIVRTTWGEHN